MQRPKKNLPPLNALKAFEAAARLKSLTRASEELHVTQGAVSQQVKLLEEYLGAPLFTRKARKLQLTDLARAYLPVLTEAFSKVQVTTQELFDTTGQPIIRLRAGTSFAQRWLVPRLADFRRQHPGFGFRLQTAIWPVGQEAEDVDLELCHGYGDYSGLIVQRIMKEHWVAMATPEYVAEHGPFDTPESLLQQPLISTMGYKETWSGWFGAQGINDYLPVSSYESDNTTMAMDMTLDHMGVMLALDSLALPLLEQGKLVQVSDFQLPAECGHYLVLPNRPIAPKVQLFCQWLFDQLADHPNRDNLTPITS